MTASTDDNAKLIDEIRRAFADVPYPGDDNLLEKDQISEAESIREEFGGMDWRDISPGDLNDKGLIKWHSNDLIFFSPEAFRYFLPAYMIVCLEDPEKADLAPDDLMYRLSPPIEDDDGPRVFEIRKKRFEGRVRQFDPAQRAVIRRFFERLFEMDPSFVEFAPDGSIDRLCGFWDIDLPRDTHEYFTVRFLIRHPDAKLQRITDGMGCDPDHSWECGTPRVAPNGQPLGGMRSDTMWTKIYRFPGRKDFFRCAEEVLDELREKKSLIAELRNSGGRLHLIVDIKGCHNVGDNLSAEAVARLEDLSLTLGLEVFPDSRRPDEVS